MTGYLMTGYSRNNLQLLRCSAYCTFVRNFIWWKFTYFVLLRSIPHKLLKRGHTNWVVLRYLILYCTSSASIRHPTQTRFVAHFYTIFAIPQKLRVDVQYGENRNKRICMESLLSRLVTTCLCWEVWVSSPPTSLSPS